MEFNSIFENLVQLKIIKSPQNQNDLMHCIREKNDYCIEIDWVELEKNQLMLIERDDKIYFIDSTLPLNFNTILLVSVYTHIVIYLYIFIIIFFLITEKCSNSISSNRDIFYKEI